MQLNQKDGVPKIPVTVEFRGDPLFKTERKYINKIRGVSKNDMTQYLETACVTKQKGTQMLKKNPQNYFT